MHVVFVLPDLPLSGAATRTTHLARELVAAGDNVTVVVLIDRVAGTLVDRLAAEGAAMIILTRSLDRRRLAARLSSSRPAVVHAAMPTAGAAGFALARRYGLPFVYSVTNCLHVDRPLRRETPRDRLKVWLERSIARHADAVHAVSAPLAEQVARRHPSTRGRLHTAVHLPTAPQGRPDAVPGSVHADATPRLLVVGQLIDHKRVLDAIRATALLRNRWPRVHLAVVGSGPRLDSLRVAVRCWGLADHVTLVGESEEPAAYFAWADVLVHPSLYEGYPRVVAEAMASGIPTACAHTAHSPAGPGIHLARSFDPGSLADAIIDAVRSGVAGSSVGGESGGAPSTLRAVYKQLLDAHAYRSRSSL